MLPKDVKHYPEIASGPDETPTKAGRRTLFFLREIPESPFFLPPVLGDKTGEHRPKSFARGDIFRLQGWWLRFPSIDFYRGQ